VGVSEGIDSKNDGSNGVGRNGVGCDDVR
jgi:hypothetical protein